MALIKLNRINKGGSIFVNSDYILFVEIEARTTTVHMANNLLFSVEETIEEIAIKIDEKDAERITTGIRESGLAGKKD
jgi:uncharacterized protein YlzI (FlbEa/FlbD family)